MPTFLQKAVSFLRAVTSGKDKKLQDQRDAICNACDQFIERPAKNAWGKWIMQGFCKACGCGMRSMADMKRGKNAYRKMKCPRGYWPGDAESKGLTLKEANTLYGAFDRLEYNMALVQCSIDKQKPLDPAAQASIFGQPPQHNQSSPKPSAGAVAAENPIQQAARRQIANAQTLPQAVPAAQFKQAFPHSPATNETALADALAAIKDVEEGGGAKGNREKARADNWPQGTKVLAPVAPGNNGNGGRRTRSQKRARARRRQSCST